MYPMTHRRIQQSVYVFIYRPWSRNHSFFRDNELPKPGNRLSLSGVADFVVKEGLELRKEREEVAFASAATADAEVRTTAEVEEFGFVGEFISERRVEPVLERVGGVTRIVETGDCGLAEHGVRVYIVVGFVDVVHVCSLLSADIWKADDFCRI